MNIVLDASGRQDVEIIRINAILSKSTHKPRFAPEFPASLVLFDSGSELIVQAMYNETAPPTFLSQFLSRPTRHRIVLSVRRSLELTMSEYRFLVHRSD